MFSFDQRKKKKKKKKITYLARHQDVVIGDSKHVGIKLLPFKQV